MAKQWASGLSDAAKADLTGVLEKSELRVMRGDAQFRDALLRLAMFYKATPPEQREHVSDVENAIIQTMRERAVESGVSPVAIAHLVDDVWGIVEAEASASRTI